MRLRPATLQDAELLWQWRTDPITVMSLPNPHGLSAAAHVAWVEQRCKRPHFYMFEDDTGVILGTVRLDAREEISITVAPAYRGHGFSVPLIFQAAERADAPVIARILPTNHASVKAFLRAGFQKDPADLYHYRS